MEKCPPHACATLIIEIIIKMRLRSCADVAEWGRPSEQLRFFACALGLRALGGSRRMHEQRITILAAGVAEHVAAWDGAWHGAWHGRSSTSPSQRQQHLYAWRLAHVPIRAGGARGHQAGNGKSHAMRQVALAG